MIRNLIVMVCTFLLGFGIALTLSTTVYGTIIDEIKKEYEALKDVIRSKKIICMGIAGVSS